MTDELYHKIFSTEQFQTLGGLNITQAQPAMLHGISGSLHAFAAVALFRRTNGQVLVVTDTAERASKLRDDCAVIAGDANVALMLVEPRHAAQAMDMTAPLSQIETLKALRSNLSAIYITHATAVGFGVPDQMEFSGSIIEISIATEHEFQPLLQRLSDLGFERKQIVETYGDFAVRGGILDVFPFIGEHPVRIEFWGDTVESIREFDVLSQRSIRELQSVSIVPDVLRTGKAITDSTIESSPRVNLLSYFNPEALLYLEDESLLQKEFDELTAEGVQIDFPFDVVKEKWTQFPR